MDINYLKHLRKIYENYSNINGKEIKIMWNIIGRYVGEIESGEIDYSAFGKYVGNIINEANIK